jgi:hypothetical protein
MAENDPSQWQNGSYERPPSGYSPAPMVVQQPGYNNALWAAAQMKDFTTPAVVTFFLYLLFFIPGLIVNIMYLSEAGRIKKITGRQPTGMGCLQVMLVVNLCLIGLACLFACGLPFLGLGLGY